MKENKDKENQLNIEISEEMAEGVYSNMVMIAHSHTEFILDFTRIMPNVPKAKVKARVIVTPEHAKRLLAALEDNIKKYEENYGSVKSSNDTVNIPFGFGGAVGEA